MVRATSTVWDMARKPVQVLRVRHIDLVAGDKRRMVRRGSGYGPTIMTETSTPPATRAAHPDWCDIYSECVCGGDVQRHRGARTAWTPDTDDCGVSVELVRSDETAGWLPAAPIAGEVLVRVSVFGGSDDNAHADVDLDAAGCRRLAAELLARAELLDNPST